MRPKALRPIRSMFSGQSRVGQHYSIDSPPFPNVTTPARPCFPTIPAAAVAAQELLFHTSASVESFMAGFKPHDEDTELEEKVLIESDIQCRKARLTLSRFERLKGEEEQSDTEAESAETLEQAGRAPSRPRNPMVRDRLFMGEKECDG